MAQDSQKEKNSQLRPPLRPRPAEMKPKQIIDPEFNVYHTIYNYLEMDPSTIEYPTEKAFLEGLTFTFSTTMEILDAKFSTSWYYTIT